MWKVSGWLPSLGEDGDCARFVEPIADDDPPSSAVEPGHFENIAPGVGPIKIIGQPIDSQSVGSGQITGHQRADVGDVASVDTLDDVQVDIRVEEALLLPVEIDADGVVHARHVQGNVPLFGRVQRDARQRVARGVEQEGIGWRLARQGVAGHQNAGGASACVAPAPRTAQA